MFNQARIKITIWYVVATMTVSLLFSLFIYQSVSFEFERGLRRAAMMQEAERQNIRLPLSPPPRFVQMHPQIFNQKLTSDMTDNLMMLKRRFIGWLVLINTSILVVSLALGYYLAGKSLEPLEKAAVSQKKFVADASHELKTPLAVMRTSIDVFLRNKKSTKKDLTELTDSLLIEIDQLKYLTDNLLTLTNLEHQLENRQKLNLQESLKFALDRIKPLAKDKKIKLVSDLKQVNIFGQKEGLKKLWLILLDNAVKYTPEKGKIEVTLRENKGLAEIEISDSGVGISKSDQAKIFDRFFRADQSRTKKDVDGFGLGLAIAQMIVSQHKGKIEVKSKVGQGTSFIVSLPVV